MDKCDYGNSAFINCSTNCPYKGHEYDCPLIKEYERKKNND